MMMARKQVGSSGRGRVVRTIRTVAMGRCKRTNGSGGCVGQALQGAIDADETFCERIAGDTAAAVVVAHGVVAYMWVGGGDEYT